MLSVFLTLLPRFADGMNDDDEFDFVVYSPCFMCFDNGKRDRKIDYVAHYSC